MEEELRSQPECWERSAALADTVAAKLPERGERVAVVGCGTSWFMAQSYAALREAANAGETDAFAASEYTFSRSYDRVVVISRSGTTSELLDLVRKLAGVRTLAITTDVATPLARIVDDVVCLGFADERSVVQTRFATSALTLLRAHTGYDISRSISDAREALMWPVPDAFVRAEQFTFLGSGWTCGLAQEAALKMREAAQAWTEAYPAKEYRHGPISISEPGRIAWMIGALPNGLDSDIAETGGTLVDDDLDGLADLVRAQRLALAIAASKRLNPDQPRSLTRSVILEMPAPA